MHRIEWSRGPVLSCASATCNTIEAVKRKRQYTTVLLVAYTRGERGCVTRDHPVFVAMLTVMSLLAQVFVSKGSFLAPCTFSILSYCPLSSRKPSIDLVCPQAFYVCHGDGRGEGMLCPNGTIFSQELLVCDWWFNVDCK